MHFQAQLHDSVNRSLHNAQREIASLRRELERARRCVASSRATLTLERQRARETVEVLDSLIGHAEREDVVASPGFLAMHAKVARTTLGY